MGRTDQRPAAAGLLCERAARRDDGGFARLVRGLFWHDRRTSLWVERCRRYLDRDRAGSASSALSRSADPAVGRNPKLAGGEKSQIPMPKSQVNPNIQNTTGTLPRESVLLRFPPLGFETLLGIWSLGFGISSC